MNENSRIFNTSHLLADDEDDLLNQIEMFTEMESSSLVDGDDDESSKSIPPCPYAVYVAVADVVV